MANIIQQLKNANGDNIYPIAYAQGGAKMDLLWENPNPSSDFTEQTINIDMSEYAFILFEIIPFKVSTKNRRIFPFIPDGHQLVLQYFDRTSIYQREVHEITQNSITIYTATKASYGGSWSNDNSVLIPARIYGIKMSYIVPTSVHGLQYVEV